MSEPSSKSTMAKKSLLENCCEYLQELARIENSSLACLKVRQNSTKTLFKLYISKSETLTYMYRHIKFTEDLAHIQVMRCPVLRIWTSWTKLHIPNLVTTEPSHEGIMSWMVRKPMQCSKLYLETSKAYYYFDSCVSTLVISAEGHTFNPSCVMRRQKKMVPVNPYAWHSASKGSTGPFS